MAERKNVTVGLFQSNSWGHPAEVPEHLEDFVSWAQTHLDQAPAEFRNTAKINIESESEPYDGGCTVSISIYYERPETDAEMAERETNEVARKPLHQRQLRTQYEQLKEIFEK